MSSSSPSVDPLASLLFSDLSLSPKGACQFGADALAAERVDLADGLIRALGPALLPSEPLNPWDGPAGLFWRAAIPLNRVDWLSLTIGALPKDQAQLCARDLLTLSAKAKAFESFDYLLSLGVARRSKKVLVAAYLNGGHGAARKVKKPTANEAIELLSPRSRQRDTPAPAHEDMLWAASFLAPAPCFNWAWLRDVAVSQSDEQGALCVKLHDVFKMDLTPANAPIFCAHLASVGASKTALAIYERFNLTHNVALAPELSIFSLSRLGDLSTLLKFTIKAPTLMETALLGRSSEFCERLIIDGAQPPALARFVAISAPDRHWLQERYKSVIDQANALRETLELRGSLGSPAPSSKPPSRAL